MPGVPIQIPGTVQQVHHEKEMMDIYSREKMSLFINQATQWGVAAASFDQRRHSP